MPGSQHKPMPSDMSIAQLMAEAREIIHKLNAVNDQLFEALGVNGG